MRRRLALLTAGVLLFGACGAADASAPATTETSTTVAPTTSESSTSTAATTTARPTTTTSRPRATTTSSSTTTTLRPRPTPTTSSSTSTTSISTMTSTTTTTIPVIATTLVPPTTGPPPPATAPPLPPTPEPVLDPGSVELATLTPTVHFLTPYSLAISVSVWRDGQKYYGTAAGSGAAGQPMTTDTPLVLASVSKLITGLTVVRLAQAGLLDLNAAVPWDEMGVPHDPAWNDVTVQELLWHYAGMPSEPDIWFDDPGPCVVPLAQVMAAPPTITRGTWRYSNGNYCALGMLIEHVTFQRFDDAARAWVFDRAGIVGPHLTSDGLLPTDGPYALDVRRLDRLGGAGTWMASSDDIAALLASLTDEDRALLSFPGVMADQYGWGHTGTVDGAKACAWVMEGGRTVVVGLIASNRPPTGGKLCDALVPALAADLGIAATGPPIRLPH